MGGGGGGGVYATSYFFFFLSSFIVLRYARGNEPLINGSETCYLPRWYIDLFPDVGKVGLRSSHEISKYFRDRTIPLTNHLLPCVIPPSATHCPEYIAAILLTDTLLTRVSICCVGLCVIKAHHHCCSLLMLLPSFECNVHSLPSYWQPRLSQGT
jgi:hypothetical protein